MATNDEILLMLSGLFGGGSSGSGIEEGDALLLETGDFLLLEDGSKLLLEA